MRLKTRCSDPGTRPGALWPLIVAEGMPGAGKTTAVQALAADGLQVVGEYVSVTGQTIALHAHPPVGDDTAHQRNWILKHHQATDARRAGPVLCDRDWLSALAYAASLDDDGQLLRARATWATERLRCRDLTVASIYVLFPLDPQESLTRRAGRLTSGHPWSTLPGLRRLTAFYADPVRAIERVDEGLAHALCVARWHQMSAATTVESTTAHLRTLMARS